jgi:hypothetical protein
VSALRAPRLALALALTLIAPGASLAQDEKASTAAASAELARSPLADLVGAWSMDGQVGAQPVRYALRADWALGGAFLRLAMSDVEPPSDYQAEVFIGWDPVSEHFVCHWLDVFGARASETLGFGIFDGDSLTFVFEYPDGPFRTTFERDSAKKWRVTMRSKEGRGPWRTFAEYTLTRARAPDSGRGQGAR